MLKYPCFGKGSFFVLAIIDTLLHLSLTQGLKNIIANSLEQKRTLPKTRFFFCDYATLNNSMYSCYVTTQPSIEPVDVTTLQAYLRVNTSIENSLLPGFITSARMLFETSTNLGLITQTITQYIETPPPYEFYLMRGQVQSLTSVTYVNSADTPTTATGYNTDLKTGRMGRVWFPNGQPSFSNTVRPVMTLVYQIGYGDTADSVPAPICQAILLCAAYWFNQREAYSNESIKSVPQGFEAICDAYRIGNQYSWNMDKHRHQNFISFPWCNYDGGYWNGY